MLFLYIVLASLLVLGRQHHHHYKLVTMMASGGTENKDLNAPEVIEERDDSKSTDKTGQQIADGKVDKPADVREKHPQQGKLLIDTSPQDTEPAFSEEFITKIRGLSKSERRRTLSELRFFLDEDEDVLEEMKVWEREKDRRKLQSTVRESLDSNYANRTSPDSTHPQPVVSPSSANVSNNSLTITVGGNNSSSSSHTLQLRTSGSDRIKTFSGKKPTPNGELDFRTWSMKARQIQDDDNLTDKHRRKTIVDSLISPALDIIKGVADKSAQDIIDLLQVAYGDIRSKRSQMNAFYNMYPEKEQVASSYLQDLHKALMELIENGHLSVTEIPGELVNQFVEAFYDDYYSQKLNLSVDMDNPPTFGALLLALRTEEGRKLEREARMRMRQQLSKGKDNKAKEHEARISSMQTTIDNLTKQSQKQSDTAAGQDEDFSKKLTAMQKQINALSQDRKSAVNTKSSQETTHSKTQAEGKAYDPDRPPRYCYRCGKQGSHVAYQCRSKPDEELVKQRAAEMKAYLNAKGFH